jgi:hypothetical protein
MQVNSFQTNNHAFLPAERKRVFLERREHAPFSHTVPLNIPFYHPVAKMERES